MRCRGAARTRPIGLWMRAEITGRLVQFVAKTKWRSHAVGLASVNRLSARKRPWLRPAFVAGMIFASASGSDAQIIPKQEFVMPPWNAQTIFSPTPLPELTDSLTRDDVAPEDTPVKNRRHPEYLARGIRTGDWMFNPSLTAGAIYDSNVFSSSFNPQSDIAAQLGTALRAHSLWDRHGVDLQLSTQSVFYRNHPGLNQTDVTFNGSGRIDIDHSAQILGNLQAAYLHEEVGTLSSPTGAVEPTPFSFFSGDLTLRKEFGRVTTSLGGRISSYDFGSTRAQDGSIINQDARDGQIYSAHGRFDYAFSDKSTFFTLVEGNWRNLRGTLDQSLESNGYRALAGFDLEFTHLIKGEIAAGYMSQHFFASSIGNIEGPAYRAMLTWSPSRQIDVHFNAEQIVTETSDTSATAVLANAVQAGFDYELRPNVILSTAAAYEKDQFKGQPRVDNVYSVDTRVQYFMNNVSSLSLRYRYIRRDSNFPDASFDKHQVGINAAAHF
jgi:hypothetical protein